MKKLATGILTWCASERRSNRYGFVFAAGNNFAGTADVAPELDTGLLTALQGHRVTLTCVVIETRDSGHIGDLFLGIAPSRPAEGDTYVLGHGTLAIQIESDTPHGLTFGLSPQDCRAELWIDPRILYRLHDQTVEFWIEETTAPDHPAPDLKSEFGRGAVSIGDGSIQISGIAENEKIAVKPVIEPLGEGLFALKYPKTMGHRGEFIPIADPD